MASADLRAELDCSICLNIYMDPIMLKCGHNFCLVCIDCVFDTQEENGGYCCPQCREEFQERPPLQRNRTLRNITQHFLSAPPDPEKTGISCTYCIHTSVPAVKSCLLCEASLCENHLRVHSKSPVHVLCDPTTTTEKMKCSVHKKILEYCCTEDTACICISCSLTGEQTGKADGETRRVTALFQDLRRHLEDLEKRILSEIAVQAEWILSPVNDLIQQLELKMEELSKKILPLKELCAMTDPLTILQESDTGDLYDTGDGDEEDTERHDELLYDGGDLDLSWVSDMFRTGLSDIITGVIGGIYFQKAVDMVLDEDIASNFACISNDKKTLSWSGAFQYRPETEERFTDNFQVLGNQSFSSGRHYWEVDVQRSNNWIIGMCYDCIDREGDDSLIGCNDVSWGLDRRGKKYKAVHDYTVTELPDDIPGSRVRVYLDYEAGQISFYMCDPIRHLHTFTAYFTEPLYPVLGVWHSSISLS